MSAVANWFTTLAPIDWVKLLDTTWARDPLQEIAWALEDLRDERDLDNSDHLWDIVDALENLSWSKYD